ncbi:MAG: short-subunit dehydrogenase [Glaciecola sp.]|jgi:short-subunit dehydrogenase
MKQYNEPVAVVTGAASGIGKALSIILADKGYHLALADKDFDGLKTLQQQIEIKGVECLIASLDVSDNEAFIAFAQQTHDKFNRIDMLFNNAGVSLIDSVENQALEDFHWLMNINFWGVVHGTNAFLPYLKASPSGHIVNISSLFGLLSLPLQSAYNSSKYAVRGFTEALKMEMAGSNLAVHCVHPGGIKTNITNNAKVSTNAIPKSQLIADFNKVAKTTAEQAADIILAGIEKKQRRILVGGDAKLLDRIARWFPSSYEKILGFEKDIISKRKALPNK